MKGLKLLIVAAAAVSALCVGLGAQAAPDDDLAALVQVLSAPLG